MKGLSRARNESSQIGSPCSAGTRTAIPTIARNRHRTHVLSNQLHCAIRVRKKFDSVTGEEVLGVSTVGRELRRRNDEGALANEGAPSSNSSKGLRVVR